MASILFALTAAVSWGVSDFMGGYFTRRMPIAPVMFISQAVGFALLLGLALLQGPPSLDPRSAAFAVAASATGLVGIAALYRGMSVGLVSLVAPISATGAALPVIFGLLRGERASALQAAGMALALLGIVLASLSPSPSSANGGKTYNAAGGVGLALIAALGFGAFFVLLSQASTAGVLWAGAVQRMTGVILLSVVMLLTRASLAVGWQRLPPLVAIGVLDTGANVLYGLASTIGLVSVAAVLASLFPVVTVILARIVLHERLAAIQAAGVVSALTGVALIATP